MDASKYYDIPSQDEIKQFQQLKSHEITTKLDLKWKNSIKEQIEDEINRKVREALDTPPHEKVVRFQQAALVKRKEKHNLTDLNSHLNFNERDRNKYSTKLFTSLTETSSAEHDKTAENQSQEKLKDRTDVDLSNKFEYWLKPQYEPQQFSSSGVMLKLNNDTDDYDDSEEMRIFRTGFDAMQNFGSLTIREREILFSTFTKDGFKDALRTGRLQDGSKLEALANGNYRDKYGIVRDKHGPFWPKQKGPLCPTPHHKRILLDDDEPLGDQLSEKDCINERSSHNRQFLGIWRHNQMVFDSEFSARDQRAHVRGDNMCPDLIFESRFESGNLRQARRTGQTDYELVLQNDIFTTRHTQWFYFRIQNMLSNVTYKFIILNLLKPRSLYMDGMRMLMYSDKSANSNNGGWRRVGHNIKYSRNITKLQCSLLNREIAYYQLEFQIEFPNSDDVCYLAHCYPYTFTDLKNDLELHLSANNTFNSVIKKDVLCETRLGNSCFVVTITDFSIPDNEKQGAVITARVHPGETNSSWMMNGLIQFLTSDAESAQRIRKRMLFKIIPMLNPDGVIMGNYRCSSSGRDMNRNYRVPREESFPTIFHTKKLVERLKETCRDVALYCDLHGHSRKHNVFMYGCDSQYLDCGDVNDVKPVLTADTVQTFVKDRIFPWLMQKHRPNMFAFSECQFKIRRCKESTGRVVMWKEFNVSDSYTLETTFCGSNFDNSSRRHFNTSDLEIIGRTLSEALLSYTDIINDEKLDGEVRLEVLKTILKQLAHKSSRLKNLLRLSDSGKSQKLDEGSVEEVGSNTNKVLSESKDENALLDTIIDNFQINDLHKLGDLEINISDIEENSSSSDSDSESQPEEIVEIEEKQRKNRKKKKKLKMLFKDKPEILKKNTILKRINSKHFQIIKSDNKEARDRPTYDKIMKSNILPTSKTYPMRPSPLFISKFDGRSNGGIPCFAEERLEERARRRSYNSLKTEIENALFKKPFDYDDTVLHLKSDDRSVVFSTTSEDLMKQYRLLHKRSSDILGYRHSIGSNACAVDETSQEIKKERNIQKPLISQNHVNEMKDTNLRHYSVYQTGNNAIFKSIPTENVATLAKQIVVAKNDKNKE